MPQTQSSWQRRFRRLFFFVGTASTFYLLSSYLLDRLKENRLRAIKEKRHKDLLKNHFTSLISSISFTLYALLPTLQPQVFEAYPVEKTSQAIQGSASTSASSTMAGSTSSIEISEPLNSLHLYGQGSQELEPPKEVVDNQSPQFSPSVPLVPAVDESWASEFQKKDSAGAEAETESGIMVGGSVEIPETDDGLSSTVSQSISLPATDTTSGSPSPSSDMSSSAQLGPSPPMLRDPTPSPPVVTKSKKELWKELKIQSIARTITTAYLLPMLYLLTSSQLSILARNTYLNDLASENSHAKGTSDPRRAQSHDNEDQYDEDDDYQTPRRNASEATLTGLSVERALKKNNKKATGWFSSFSVESMGLTEFVENHTSFLPNPIDYLPGTITSYLPSFLSSRQGDVRKNQAQRIGEVQVAEMARQRRIEEEEAERLFLSYSWWLLNEGWKGVAERVDEAVGKVFGLMLLKKELSLHDWEKAIKEIRAQVEMDEAAESGPKLFDFTPFLLPLNPPTSLRAPFPYNASDHSSHLVSLFDETLTHLCSADGRYLLEKGIATLTRSLVNSLREECYALEATSQSQSGFELEGRKKRLAECLPVVSRWGKNIWENVPDSGVEEMLAVPEFEGFAAIIFGDWAGK
ncbi:hypothetical protein LQV05_002603 [Cryptococcus neoformans]|nr:peroxin-3 [Cryptococcus neoformans var. grubii]OXC63025.1 peroxin-3 [Cryptococcus neoformans var. grubii MW-RSA852]UOH79954.1 hypothetical protein LQV05_002603 [Cryptococcus neoformans]